jgi:peptidoglycan hydrolase-like protein with peptidoglycan-binding domain
MAAAVGNRFLTAFRAHLTKARNMPFRLRAIAMAPMIDDTGEESDEKPARRRAPVSTVISLALVAMAGTAITWNALYNQSPRSADTAARTIELKAERPAAKPATKQAAKPAKAAKPAGKAGAAEVAVDASPSRADAGAASAQTVAALQVQLAALGAYAGPANGALDDATAAAVDRYRTQNSLDPNLPLDGVLEHARFAAEIVQAANFTPEVGAAAGAGAATGEATANAGPAGAAKDEVVFVQKGLAELGYAPGPADGHLGDITRRAIRDFQAERRLPVNGEITPELIAELKKTSGLTTFLTRP